MDEHLDNWVRARAECTAEKMFLLLAERVEADTKEISKLVDGRSVTFAYDPPSEVNKPSFRVVRKRNAAGVNEGKAVTFELESNKIVVRDVDPRGDRSERLTVGYELDENGQCVFEIGSVRISTAEVSRKALESLFFEFF